MEETENDFVTNDNEQPEQLVGDPENWRCMFNARQFVEATLKANPRIQVVGAGCGECYSDLDITIDGAPFNVGIRFREVPR